jgi:hypothetical protein
LIVFLNFLILMTSAVLPPSAPFTALPASRTPEIVIGALSVAIVVLIVVICIVAYRHRDNSDLSAPSSAAPERQSAMSSLIPPVFLTEEMPNPLMQADLRDRLPADLAGQPVL